MKNILHNATLRKSYFLVSLCLISALVCNKALSQHIQFSSTVSERIQQVENNLNSSAKIYKDTSWTLRERMVHYHVKGLSIAVIRNYKIDWAKGYGWADEGEKTPVTPNTLFQAGSISKSINSVGVLKLVQDGRISLNTDINHYLKNWKFPYDSVSKGKKITVENLLTHTAGLSVHGFNGYEQGSVIPTINEVLDGKSPANTKPVRSIFEPGTKFEYSGGGTIILQRIIMDVSGLPYDEFMYRNVLAPLNMRHSTYSQAPEKSIKFVALSAGFDKQGHLIPGKHHIYPEQAAAGLWTTPTDLAKYIIETQLAYKGRSAKVLNAKTTKIRLTPYFDPSIGLGLFIVDNENTRYFEHGGDDKGFNAQYFGSFKDGNGLVIMVNSDGSDIIPEIVNSIAKVYRFKGLTQ
jgi:CubicO group peptidase (beta-lactamase class C family)